MTMTMISPFSGAPEQQDLIPLGGNQEFRRRRGLGWFRENLGVTFRGGRRRQSKAPGEEVPEAPLSGSHAARYMGRVGPPNLGLVALLSSVFFPLPLSR